MATFNVTLKRVIVVELTMNADSAADIRRELNEETSNDVLSYFHQAPILHSDSITVQSVKKVPSKVDVA